MAGEFQPPAGTQEIAHQDLEVLPPIEDAAPPAEPDPYEEPAAAEPTDPAASTEPEEYVDPFDAMFAKESEAPADEPTPGAAPPAAGDETTVVPDPAAAAPAATPRPEWLPAEIDHQGLSESELLRLRVVREAAAADQQMTPQEAAVLDRYRQLTQAQTAGQQPAQAVQPQPYQPSQVAVPEGYESDPAIRTLVQALNQQNAETAHLLNQQAGQVAQLGQAVGQTARTAEQSALVTEWQQFQIEHPEARDAEVQKKINDKINFWYDTNKQPRQAWAAALQEVMPAAEPAAPAAPDHEKTIERGRRARAATAANPPSQTRAPAKREPDLEEIHQRNGSFADVYRALYG